jgi:hypothetical protein
MKIKYVRKERERGGGRKLSCKARTVDVSCEEDLLVGLLTLNEKRKLGGRITEN